VINEDQIDVNRPSSQSCVFFRQRVRLVIELAFPFLGLRRACVFRIGFLYANGASRVPFLIATPRVPSVGAVLLELEGHRTGGS